MKLSRIMLAAPASGSGKTLITCGILQALKNRGMKLSSFKCGPDYIDPMFHGRILGISSKNLDTYFTGEDMTRYLFVREAKKSDFSVLEGVMGYYDGLAGISLSASAYDVAGVTKTPVVLVVNAKGMSTSVTALIQGFLQFQKDSRIAGVILNHTSEMLYPRLKEQIEKMLPVKVLGYVPTVSEYVIESRHLGLVTPNEILDLQEKLEGLAKVLETTIDLDALVELGNQAEELSIQMPDLPEYRADNIRIGIASDEAFCFYYRDNLELLENLGAKLLYFSPLHDRKLPKNLNGLIFYGGYPELYAKKLSENQSMVQDIQDALAEGMPYLAECGGFMYLHESMEDMQGNIYPMVGVIQGTAYKTPKLGRFGYIALEAQKNTVLGDSKMTCKGHEFHYFDSTNNGSDFIARKPLAKRSWECIHGNEKSIAGFPHFYYYSNPQMIVHFYRPVRVQIGGLMKIELENVLPMDIEKRSFEIITEELHGRVFLPEQENIIKRVIHTTADFEYADSLYFSEGVIRHVREAIKKGACIVTDTQMAMSGINKKALAKFGGEVYNFMADADVAEIAKKNGTTRATACMDKAASLNKPLIFAIGNAPTALVRLYELIQDGKLRPELIIGVPVGFVNVVQSKELIMQTDVPYIIARGRKGGSNVAAAICNAILYDLDKTRGTS